MNRATEIAYTLPSQETDGLLVVAIGWRLSEWRGGVERHLRLELCSADRP